MNSVCKTVSLHRSDVSDALIVPSECGGVLGQQGDDEIVGIRFEVLDERDDGSVSTASSEFNNMTGFVSWSSYEIVRECEHEPGDFVFALREVLDRILAGRARQRWSLARIVWMPIPRNTNASVGLRARESERFLYVFIGIVDSILALAEISLFNVLLALVVAQFLPTPVTLIHIPGA